MIFEKRLGRVSILLGLLLGTIAAFLAWTTQAYPHDGYGRVYEHNAPPSAGKQLCCGGDIHTGDCEAMSFEQVEVLPEGVRLTSTRYGGVVFVPTHRIEWGIPLNGDTGQPAFPNDKAFAHWCGKPRATVAAGSSIPTPDQPDTAFWTYCAFVKTGGM